jgi:hypothetical protein
MLNSNYLRTIFYSQQQISYICALLSHNTYAICILLTLCSSYTVSYNDGNILLNWTQNNVTENTEGPVHLDESTKQMPQFEVLRIDTKESKVRRRDLGKGRRLYDFISTFKKFTISFNNCQVE